MTTEKRREDVPRAEVTLAATYRKFGVIKDFPVWLERFKASTSAEEAIGLLHHLFDGYSNESPERFWFLIAHLSPDNASGCKDEVWVRIREKAASVVVQRLLKGRYGFDREALAIGFLMFNHGITGDFVKMLAALDPDTKKKLFDYEQGHSSEKVICAFLEALARILRGEYTNSDESDSSATMRRELSEVRDVLFQLFFEHRLDGLCRLTRGRMFPGVREILEELKKDREALLKIVLREGFKCVDDAISCSVFDKSAHASVRAAELYLIVDARIRVLETKK
jgi:hypothetical protein